MPLLILIELFQHDIIYLKGIIWVFFLCFHLTPVPEPVPATKIQSPTTFNQTQAEDDGSSDSEELSQFVSQVIWRTKPKYHCLWSPWMVYLINSPLSWFFRLPQLSVKSQHPGPQWNQWQQHLHTKRNQWAKSRLESPVKPLTYQRMKRILRFW